MPSILSNNPLQTTDTPQQNSVGAVKSLVDQILGSANPKQMFDQIVSNNKQAQDAMNLVNQYGNGDPKAAFMNYAASMGKQNLGQQIMQNLGLG